MRILSILFLLVASPLNAHAAGACAAPEFRQFDYWLGAWDVFNAEGVKIGENRITLEQGGCVLHEHWQDARGGTGESFNMYDRSRDVWHQTWVAATGNLLLLEGRLEDGHMVLTGVQQVNGKAVHNRIRWQRQDDGSVHQRWEQSMDGGETWQLAFLGIYRRR